MKTGKQEIIHNWPMLAVASVLIFLAFGVPTYSLPFVYNAAMDELGWTNAQVNLLSTAKFLVGAVAALTMGILVDKLGGRSTVLAGTAVGGVAMALFLFATTLPVYYLAGALLGFSASSIVAAMKVVVTRLFTMNQGLAMGIVLTATSLGGIVGLIWPPLLEIMNWRQVMALLSLGPFLIAVPLWLLFMRMSARMREVVSAPTVLRPGAGSTWQHFKGMSKDRKFWLIATGVFLVSAVDQALMQNYVSFLRADKGIVLSTLGWVSTLLAFIGVIGKIGSGWFYDRYSIRGIMFFYLLLSISVLLGLPVAGMLSMLLFVAVRGIAHGGMIVDVPVLTRHYFGMERIGLTMGVLSVCVNLGFAAGPPVFGLLADLTGSFTVGLIVFGCVAGVASLTLLPVKPRYWTSPAARREGPAAAPAPVRPATAQ